MAASYHAMILEQKSLAIKVLSWKDVRMCVNPYHANFQNACAWRWYVGRNSSREVCRGPMHSKVKPCCHRTTLLVSYYTIDVMTPANLSCTSWKCTTSQPVTSLAVAQQTQYCAGKPSCVNVTTGKLIRCPYETSHGTDRTESSNQRIITSRNVIAGFYCTPMTIGCGKG